jgi:hypothetical protein
LRRRALVCESGRCGDGGRVDFDARMDLTFHAAYGWVAERVGFWPVFLAVGSGDEARHMTGYQDQWRRWRTTDGEETRPKSRVLFSWCHPPPAIVFMDFDAWHIVLNAVEFDGEDVRDPWVRRLPSSAERRIWKRSWRAADWVRMAGRGVVSVQAVAPELDLRTADELWCRNRACAKRLADAGFDPSRVVVKRRRVNPW